MAQTTISHLFASYDEAVLAVADLQTAGVPADDIDLIESEADARLPAGVADDVAQPPAVAGATIGAGIGGGIGALIGVGAISVPFLNPVAQTGWLLPTVIGAGVGGAIGAVIGTITKLGVTSQQAHSVAEGLQRGQHLVMVRVDDSVAAQALAMLRRPRAAPTAMPPVPPGEEPAAWEDPAAGTLPREGQRVRYP
jgi:hypothetical protein